MIIPLVSIIIPCRNENKFIAKSLNSILDNDFDKAKMEIMVIDGMSNDGTRDIIKSYCEKYPFIKLLDNTERITPAALNIGIKHARGDVIIRMDAHNLYAVDYISKCIKYLYEYNADNTGGIWITRPGGDTLTAKAIALAVSHKFGVGNAHYRTGIDKPVFVDTVPFGCYRKEVFEKIGLFDIDLVRNQDDEFNLRLIKNGGKILLVPDIVSYYYARENYTKLWKMFYQYGLFKPLVVKKVKGVMTFRQVIPALFVVSIFVLGVSSLASKYLLWLFLFELSLYLLCNILFSLSLVLRNGVKLLPFLIYSFIVVHVAYGVGYQNGIVRFIIFKKNRVENVDSIAVTR